MRYEVITDIQGYVQIIHHTNSPRDSVELNLEDYDLTESRINAYKLGKDKLIFDQNRYEEILAEKQKEGNAKRIAFLKKKLAETDYIWNSIREGGRTEEYYHDIIENRKAWRKEIQELKELGGDED